MKLRYMGNISNESFKIKARTDLLHQKKQGIQLGSKITYAVFSE